MTASFLSPSCFAGKRILVTGASSGIGRVTAVLLSECGAQLTVSGRNTDRLAATYESLSGSAHCVSVAELQDVDVVAQWVKSLVVASGPFDGIFHAAGMAIIKPTRLLKQPHLDEVFGSSVMASFGIAKAAAQKDVMTDGGSVVYMSSVAGSRGQPGMAAYSASKAAIDGLVRSYACELAPRKIRVNSIVAGAVETEMLSISKNQMGDSGVGNFENRHLLGFGMPLDIANAAAFLLSPASTWITGTSMAVDGGYMVR